MRPPVIDALIGGLIALAGVTLGLVLDLVRDRRHAAEVRAAKRFDVEYDSLRQLGELLPSFVDYQGADLNARKVRAVTLGARVGNPAVRHAVEGLVRSSGWTRESIEEVSRTVGRAMREL